MVRPMLLANINDLLKREKPYEHTFEIYEEMVTRWIERERVTDKMADNQITDITPLQELNRLRKIDLTGNPINDKNSLAELIKKMSA